MKQSNAIEAEIGQLEAKIKPMSEDLDAKILAFAKVLPTIVEAWMTSEVKGQIEANAAAFNEKGIEFTRKLKADLAALVLRLPELCESAVKNRAEWPHARTSTATKGELGGPTYRISESYFAKTFRSVISNLGPLLDTYKLIGTHGYGQAWHRINTDQFRYAYGLAFDDHQIPVVAEYNGLLKHHTELANQIDAKRVELAKARATELWDSA